jgi:hypothetical protein
MSIPKRTRLGLAVAVAGINTALLLGCDGARRGGRSAEEATRAVERNSFRSASQENGMNSVLQASGKAPPIPEAGPLASPRSLQQTGLPVELTGEVTPTDNPQTPEKSAAPDRRA